MKWDARSGVCLAHRLWASHILTLVEVGHHVRSRAAARNPEMELLRELSQDSPRPCNGAVGGNPLQAEGFL